MINIKNILPHREPFLFIDEVTELEPGKRITALKYVRAEEYYFEGHFPNEKIMPGVLIVESIGQAGAVAVLSAPEHKNKNIYLCGIKEARFKQKVVPGDCLRLEATIDRIRSNAVTGAGAAYVGGKLACKCGFTLMLE